VFLSFIAFTIVVASEPLISPNSVIVTTLARSFLLSGFASVNVTVTAAPLTSVEPATGVTVAAVSEVAATVTSLLVNDVPFLLLIAARIVAESLLAISPSANVLITSLILLHYPLVFHLVSPLFHKSNPINFYQPRLH
jgi:hypothetical protein